MSARYAAHSPCILWRRNIIVLARISMFWREFRWELARILYKITTKKYRFFHPKVVRWGSNFQGLQYYRAGQLLNIWRWLDKFNGTSGFENLLFCANFVGFTSFKNITPPFLEQFPQLRPNWSTKNISPILMGVFLKERYEFIFSGKITQRLIPGPENTSKHFAFFSLRYFPEGVPDLPGESDGRVQKHNAETIRWSF